MRWLVDQSVDFESKDSEERTAVHHACAGGHIDMVRWLVDQGVALESKDSEGRSIVGDRLIKGH